MKRSLALLVLVLSGAAAALLAAEWVVRWTVPRVLAEEMDRRTRASRETTPQGLYVNTPAGRRLVPSSTTLIRRHPVSGADTVSVSVNRLGFRDRELVLPKPPGEIRILALGDSITLGNYLPAASVWVEQTERSLRRQAGAGGQRFEVINAGIDGIGLREEIDLLVEKGLAAEPDVVLVAYYLNDTCPPDGFAGSLAAPGALRRHSVLADTVYRRWKLRRWERQAALGPSMPSPPVDVANTSWATNREAFSRLAGACAMDWGAAWTDGAGDAARAQLQRLRALADHHGFRVGIVAFPVAFQVRADFVADEPQQRLRALAAEFGMPFHDLLPVLREHRDEPLFYDWCHPTERGNAYIAASVARFLAGGVLRGGAAPDGGGREEPASASGTAGAPFTLYVLGESTAFGEPYHPLFDLGRLVAYLFAGRVGDRPIDVRNLARVGISSREVLRTAEDVPAGAGVALVYTGHNEFLAFDREHDVGGPARPLCDAPTVSPERRAEVLDRFAKNVDELILALRRKKVPVILSTQVSNTADWEPNRSVLGDPAHAAAVQAGVEQGEKQLRAGQVREARETFRRVLDAEPAFAWAHKRAGDCCRLLGEMPGARDHYEKARDGDGNPYRAPARVNEILAAAAARHGVPLVQAVERFRGDADHGLIGFNVMLDNCHPNLKGYLYLADAYAGEIEKLFGVARARPLPGMEDAASAFGLDAREQSRILHAVGQYCYIHASLVWNPEDRLARADYYLQRAGAGGGTDANLLVSRAVLGALRGDAAGAREFLRQAREADPVAAEERLRIPEVKRILDSAGAGQ